MFVSTWLLASTIFVGLIKCNNCSPAISIDIDNTVAKGFYSIRNDLEDSKNINMPAILSKPSSCIGIINDVIDVFENGGNGEEVTNIDYLLGDQPLNNRCEPSQLKIKQHNDTHFATEITWTIYDRTMTIANVKVFLSFEDRFGDSSDQKPRFDLACSYGEESQHKTENNVLRFDCYIQTKLIEDLLYDGKGEGILLSAAKLIDGKKGALYQVAPVMLHDSATQLSTFHGFVSDPLSRAVLCQHRVNKNCGSVMYEPQSVEGFKNFPHGPHSPPDGKIASGNNKHFGQLDEYGADRWVRTKFPDVSCLNETHVSFNISWTLTASHASENIHVYISNEKYNSSEPLSRRHLDLQPLCTLEFYGKRPPMRVMLLCPISLEKYRRADEQKELLLLSVWNVYDTSFAFYQVMDLRPLSEEQSYKSVLQKCR